MRVRKAGYQGFWFVVAAGLLTLVGCGGEALPTTDEGVEQQIFLYGNGSEPRSLDPQIATGVPENHIISSLIEGLITYHLTNDDAPEPGVAERWESNEDASVWTFYLRKDAKWSNGDPVTAHDFVYSYERMLTPELGAEYAPMLNILKNAEAFYNGEIDDFSEVGVKAVDDHTLVLELVGPNAMLPNMLKHYSWYPVHPPTIKANGGMSDRSGAWTREGSYVGNGPFVLEDWRPNQFIKVKKSPTYWDRDTVRLNQIVFFPIEDVNTELRMFRAGRLHYTNTIPTNDIPILRESMPDKVHIDPYMGVYFYRVNVTKGPLMDPRVRKALAWAIDREMLVNKVTLGGEIPATNYVPDMFSNFHSEPAVGFDPEKARALLAEAGYPNGEGFPAINILFNTQEAHKKIAVALAEMWRRNLGIEASPLNKEWKVYLDDQSQLNYDVSRSGWIADYADPMTFIDMFTTGNGNNDTGWSNARYDELVSLAQRSASEEERIALMEEAEALLMEEMPVIPIYWYTRKYLSDPRLRNWFPKALDNRPFKYIYLEE
jgi:oligopeptide transport system substrate-binding protein